MGRKIPGKKHKGVKDPEKQRAKREAELQTKINAPPKNVDEQDIPKSLLRVIKLKNAVKNNGIVQKKKKKKKKGLKLIQLGAEQNLKKPSKGKPEKAVPVFNQEPGETTHQFWNRVNRETHLFVKETEFETKFNVDVKRNAETGEIEGIAKKPKDEISEIDVLKSKHKNIGKKKKLIDKEGNAKLSKSQKRREKLLKKQQKKDEDDIDEFKVFKDKVEFGEIVHAPPELKVRPKSVDTINNKVKTKSLLLNSILQGKPPRNENEKTIDRTGKRKNLPVGERRQLEKQQNDVIAAYRLMKARRESTMST